MAGRTVDILIAIDARLQKLEEAQKQLRQLAQVGQETGNKLKLDIDPGEAALRSIRQKTAELKAQAAGNTELLRVIKEQARYEGLINQALKSGVKDRAAAIGAVRELVAAERQVAALGQRQGADGGSGAAGSLGGIAAGLGSAALSGLVGILQVAGSELKQALVDGVQFNATVESAQIGIAATIKQFDQTGQIKTFGDAMDASAVAIDLLKQKAKESPATFQQLVTGFQGLSGAFASAGLSLRQQVDLTVNMSQALAGLGIQSDQLVQESRALVTGNISEDAMAARVLGITKADIDSARDAGQLYEFLSQKLSAFAEAGAVGAKSLNVQLANLDDNLTQLKGIATESFFSQVKEQITSLNDTLGGEKAAQTAAGFGAMIGGIINGWKEAAKWAEQLTNALPGTRLAKEIANAIGPNALFAEGARNKRVEQMQAEMRALQELARSAANEKQQKEAIAKLEDAILVRRREAGELTGVEAADVHAHADALERVLEATKSGVNAKTQSAAAQKQLTDQTKKELAEVDKALLHQLELLKAKSQDDRELVAVLEQQARIEELIAKFTDAGTEAKARALGLARELLSVEEQIAAVQGVQDANAERRKLRVKAAPPGKKGEAAADYLDVERGLVVNQLANQGIDTGDAPTAQSILDISTVGKTTEQLRALNEAYKLISDAEHQLANARREDSNLAEGYANWVREGNRLTADHANQAKGIVSEKQRQLIVEEKIAQLRSTHRDQLAAGLITEAQIRQRAEESVRLEERARDAKRAGTAARREERDLLREINERIGTVRGNPFLTAEQKDAQLLPLLRDQEGLLQQKGATPGEMEENQIAQRMATPMGQFQSQWKDWVDGLGGGAQSAADAITGTLGAAIEGVSGALSGLILGTQNWRQAFAQAASSIVEQLIQIGVQFVAHELLKMTVMDTTHRHASSLRMQETAQIIQKNTAEATSGASNALMQSLASWGVSALVGAAAFAAAMALSGGFAEGGYTGGGARMEPAGVVHRGEYVFSQPAVNRLGVNYLDSLHVKAKRGYAGGGAVGVQNIQPMAGAAGAQQPIHVNVMTSEDEMRRQLLNHPDADNRIVRVGRRRGTEMGIHRA